MATIVPEKTTRAHPPPNRETKGGARAVPIPGPPTPVAVMVNLKEKSVFEAYLLGLTLGFLGAHHFYLRRPGYGLAYLFTFGLLGVGYVADLFRMPCLVRDANRAQRNPVEGTKKTLSDAYVMWFPLGLLGFHYFYLRKPGFGFLYFFTFGLCGIGWLIDMFRIPSLVKEANAVPVYPNPEKSTGIAYLLTLFPFTGLLGIQHYYLGRPGIGLVYTLTCGAGGAGWVLDWFRMWNVVKRVNQEIRGEREAGLKNYDDAYICWFPFGFLGLHHFYLRRYGWGVLYLFTVGLFGLGWLFDLCRLPCLVNEYNKTQVESRKLLRYGTTPAGQQPRTDHTVVTITHNVPGVPPPPGYGPYPGANGYPAGQILYPPMAGEVTEPHPPPYTAGHTPYQTGHVSYQTGEGGTLDAPYQPPSYDEALHCEKPPLK